MILHVLMTTAPAFASCATVDGPRSKMQ